MEKARIPLMNVSRQYSSCKEEINEAVLRVLESGNYINGENVKAFEQEFAQYIGVKYAIGVANGTDALVLALRSLGIKGGDEVITCAFTFFATAEAISRVGATPVFVDCVRDTYVMDSAQIWNPSALLRKGMVFMWWKILHRQQAPYTMGKRRELGATLRAFPFFLPKI